MHIKFGKSHGLHNQGIEVGFIIEKINDKITMYIGNYDHKLHSQIQKHFKLNNKKILGGGYINKKDNVITFKGYSGTFGSVPDTFIEQNKSAIEQRLKEEEIFFKEIKIELVPPSSRQVQYFKSRWSFLDQQSTN